MLGKLRMNGKRGLHMPVMSNDQIAHALEKIRSGELEDEYLAMMTAIFFGENKDSQS